MENSTAGLTLLPPGRTVTLTGEEHHQPALAAYRPRDDSPREVAVALAWCRIGSGKYAGRRAIEARLDGHRIGELTHRMSQRYAPLVAEVLDRGGHPGCAAVLRHGDRGLQAELRLPAVETGPIHVDDPDAGRVGTADAATGRPGTEGPDAAVTTRFPAAPVGPWTRTRAAGHDEPAGLPGHARRAEHAMRAYPGRAGGTRARPGTDHAFPEVVAEMWPPAVAPRPAATRRARPWLIAAGVVILLLVVVGIGGRGGEPSMPLAASPAAPSVAPPVPTPVLAAPEPAPSDLAVSEPTRTGPTTTEPTTSALQSRRAGPGPTPSTARTTPPPAPKASAAAPAKPPAKVAPGGGCHSSYSGACVPIATDVDCAGGGGNGPAYLSEPAQVVGPDVYGLDSDKDGVACE